MLGSQNIKVARGFTLNAFDCFETLKYLKTEKPLNILSIRKIIGHCI